MTAATAAPTNSSHSIGEEQVTPTPPQWLESMDLSVLNQHLTVQWKEQQEQPTKTATSSSRNRNKNKGKVWKAMARSNFELIALKRRQDFEAADAFWDRCLFHHGMAREQLAGNRQDAFEHALNNLSNKFPTKQSLFKPCEFRLLSTLGEGGFGSVYKAVHIPTGHEVALKQIDRESSDIEVKEQRLMPLDCGIVPCYGTFLARGNKEDDTPLAPLKTWMILKLCPGGSLLDLLEAQQTLPEKDAARITRQLTKIVKRLHARGIVHNDIKPHNVLFDDDGSVMLCDLGVATKHDEWQPKRIGGTFSYMAPEKMKGRKHRNAQYYSHHSFDVWAIGCLLYEMLFLKLPFDTVCVADLVHFETFAGCQQQPSEKLNNFQQLMDGYGKLRIPKSASADVKCLLMQLLSVDVDQRLAIHKIKKHSWVKRHAGKWNDRVMVQLRLLAGQNDKYNDKLVATSNNNKTAAATKLQQHPTDSETTAMSLSGRISSRQLLCQQPQPQEEDCATAVVVMEV